MAARRVRYIKDCGGECLKCSSVVDLEFHHRNRDEKTDHKIWSWSIKRIEQELTKCDLLCGECHKVKTAKERNYGGAAHGTITSYKRYRCRCENCRTANANYERSRRLQVHT
jgi:hypothetical protein